MTEAVMTVVGRVVALRRYPVKSMAPEELDGAEVSWHGLAGDRRWAFVRDGQVRSGFPWLTIRERAEMARYRPFYTERARPNASATLVRTPSGGELDVAAPALVADHADPGRPGPAGRHRPGGGAVPAQPARGCGRARLRRGRLGRPGAADRRAADAGGPA